MKKTLKLTSLLFTLILAVSVVFTGCGNGRKDSTLVSPFLFNILILIFCPEEKKIFILI